MARICLEHISKWTQYQEVRPISDDDISAEKWPPLDYAVRFWHHHSERAMNAGTGAEEIELFVQD